MQVITKDFKSIAFSFGARVWSVPQMSVWVWAGEKKKPQKNQSHTLLQSQNLPHSIRIRQVSLLLIR